MKFIQGASRNQLEFTTLEDLVSSENPERVMDLFLDKVDLAKMGFREKSASSEGR